MMMMSGSGAETANLVGSAFMIISAITNALYNVLARKLTQRYSLLTITYIMTLFGFIAFNVIAIRNHVID
ncbi:MULTISPECIES: hypothetical protein [Priestia]|uniref:hypothetical protein n=1 Tax=Priestia TaxID=2800373 RepID=UPI002041C298|nr:hypothetical protein [Priestia aryabhattai]MCM3640120.1 hypothetical protein [Priestia aryabhattai]